MFGVVASCSDDEEPTIMDDDCTNANVSYQSDILPIINSSCALSGCHVAGFNNGDYTSYAGLKAKADSGRLNARVVIDQSMPPSNSPGPKTLSDAQIEAFKCWIEAGAPEN